jgi:tetratricopeptide (TPR) repeat protein
MRTIGVAAAVLMTLSLLTPPSFAQTPADRERARIQNRLGWESMRAEQWEEAARAFRKAIEIDSTYEYGHYSLGRALLALRSFDDAITALSKSVELYRAQSARIFSNVQEAQRYQRDRAIEVNELIRQLQQGPQTQRVQDQIRQLQNYLRDLRDRVQRDTSQLTLDSGVPAFVTLSLGSAYFRAGRLADAEREFKATIATDPKAGEAHNNLAVVYLETERYAEAEKAIQAAKKTGFRVHPDLEREIRDRRKQS